MCDATVLFPIGRSFLSSVEVSIFKIFQRYLSVGRVTQSSLHVLSIAYRRLANIFSCIIWMTTYRQQNSPSETFMDSIHPEPTQMIKRGMARIISMIRVMRICFCFWTCSRNASRYFRSCLVFAPTNIWWLTFILRRSYPWSMMSKNNLVLPQGQHWAILLIKGDIKEQLPPVTRIPLCNLILSQGYDWATVLIYHEANK